MEKYASGANFERNIIHYLLQKDAFLIVRGAGSKSYGYVKADIIAIILKYTVGSNVTPIIFVIQAKHSKRINKTEKEIFESAVRALGEEFVPLWLTPVNWRDEINKYL